MTATSGTQQYGLATRDVFLDTEVFKRHSLNFDSSNLKTLKESCQKSIVTFHTTDITIGEIQKYIDEKVEETFSKIESAKTSIKFCAERSPLITPDIFPAAEQKELSESMYETFLAHLDQMGVTTHEAMKVPAKRVFDKYFEKKAPFTDQKKCEFPDAFVIAALEQWCHEVDRTMYVVSSDNGMLAAAEECSSLIPINDLADIHQKVAEADDPNIKETARILLKSVERSTESLDYLRDVLEEVSGLYLGRIPGGKVKDVFYSDHAIEYDTIQVISSNQNELSLVVDTTFEFIALIEYPIESTYHSDIETDIDDVEDKDTVRLSLVIDKKKGELKKAEVIPPMVLVKTKEFFEKYLDKK